MQFTSIQPPGKFETIGGVYTYVATPTVDYPKDKAILFLTDVFGPQFINAQVGPCFTVGMMMSTLCRYG
jgi:hypothetical protein